jgi:ATP-dependent Clp protease protease subunit
MDTEGRKFSWTRLRDEEVMMLYPRVTKTGKLVTEEQMVGVREHLWQRCRVVFLSGALTGETETHNTLLALDSLEYAPIKMIITSPGGDLDSTFLLYDTMKLIKSPVWTFGRYCASAACLLLAAGERRYLSPHAKTMLHLPKTFLGNVGYEERDLEIYHREAKKYKNKMVEILRECGVTKEPEEILRDIDRDFWLEPREAIEYGLADAVMEADILNKWLSPTKGSKGDGR